MSPALYDEVQQFLSARWGEMGGWAQAVMFALDLPSATVSKGARGTASSSVSRTASSAAITPLKGTLRRGDSTPGQVKSEADVDGPDSPLAGKRKSPVKMEGAANGGGEAVPGLNDVQRPAVKRTRSSARLLAQQLNGT